MPVPTVAVVLAEPETETREAYARGLRHAGMRVIAVPDVAEAHAAAVFYEPQAVVTEIALPPDDGFELLRRLRPSAVLLDVHLPDADGRDVCRQLKHDGDLGSIPIVLISATLGGHVNSLEAVRWGECDAYLSEPVDPKVLESTLRAVLSTA